jgi:peptidoglycan/LPS O-acetylase OafA/YrhL
VSAPGERVTPGDHSTSSKVSRVRVVDGFRAYALFGVVVMHLMLISGAIEPGTRFGIVVWGVFGNVIDTFFIVSGFVLFLPVVLREGRIGSIRDWELGRAVRLIPAYWFCLALMLLLLWAVPFANGGRGPIDPPFPDVPEILGNVAALQMPIRLFDGSFPVGFGINGPLWMISIVVGFYLVFPFVAGAYYRRPLIGLALAAAVTFGWKELVVRVPGLFEWLDTSDNPAGVAQLVATDQLPGWAFSFGLGMTGAWAYVAVARRGASDRFGSRPILIGAVALAACGVCAYLYGKDANAAVAGIIGGSTAREDPVLSVAYTAARAILMAAIVLGPAWMQRPFDNGPTRRGAELSYGVYLIHVVVVFYVGLHLLDLTRDGSLSAVAAWFGVVVPISVVYALLTRRYIEVPAREWWRRRQSRATEREEPAGQLGKARPQAVSR